VTLVAHLIRKDLRAVAIAALIWIGLMSIEVALQLTGAAARPLGPGRSLPLEMMRNVLPFAEILIVALIVSLVVHEDPLVDARAFWLTRPVPRGQLFLAKLTTIAVVVFTPALVALGVLLASYHVPAVYMMRAGFELVLWLAFPLLFLTVAATLTSTLTRYLLLLFGAVVATLTVFGMLETFGTPAPAGVVFEARLPRSADPAPQVTVTLILITGFCAVLHQVYRRRDWRVALGGVALVFGLVTAVARYAPGYRFFAPLEATGEWTSPSITRLRLLAAGQTLVSAYHPREIRSVAAPLVLDGLPKGYTATPFTLNGQLTRADGTVLRSGRSGPLQVEAKGEYQPSLTLTYRNDPIDAGPTRWESWPVLLELPSGHRAASAAAVRAATGGASDTDAPGGGPAYYAGAYSGTFLYRIARHEKVAALRLDRHEEYADGPRGIHIVEAKDLGSVCRVTVEVTNTELTLAGPSEPSAGYYFVDRLTGERLRASRQSTRSGMLGPLRVGLGPGRRIFTAAYVQWDVKNPGDSSRGQSGQDDLSPCTNTDLIFVRTIAAGSLIRSITLPDFRVQPSQDTFFRR
jgi:hypothetical protein